MNSVEDGSGKKIASSSHTQVVPPYADCLKRWHWLGNEKCQQL